MLDQFAAQRAPRNIVIVGAGFSGAATAVQLLRSARSPLKVTLINESGRMARGLAYGTHSNAHVLNVPAGNMSALAEDPDDFLRYCRWSDPQVKPESFVPRRRYGAYLEALLSAAEFHAGAGVELERIVGRVIDVTPRASKATVWLEGGQQIEADAVVMAFGHFAPVDPLAKDQVTAAGARYVQDPWRPDALASIGPADDVLLVGAGLTAVDVALALTQEPRTGRLLSISRRGLPPQSHRRSGAVAGAVDGAVLVDAMGTSLRQAVRVLRDEIERRLALGEDWRDVIGALRSHTPALWHRLSPTDRGRFLRHLRPHWDVARHRCAPAAHDAFDALRRTGQLELLAARLLQMTPVREGLQVTLGPRGGGPPVTRTVQAIVNCTGPSSDLKRSRSAVVGRLLESGLLVRDPFGLGLQVDPDYRVLDREGQASARLYYIGPLLKARDWEATAVPELRVHAQRLAKVLLQD